MADPRSTNDVNDSFDPDLALFDFDGYYNDGQESLIPVDNTVEPISPSLDISNPLMQQQELETVDLPHVNLPEVGWDPTFPLQSSPSEHLVRSPTSHHIDVPPGSMTQVTSFSVSSQQHHSVYQSQDVRPPTSQINDESMQSDHATQNPLEPSGFIDSTYQHDFLPSALVPIRPACNLGGPPRNIVQMPMRSYQIDNASPSSLPFDLTTTGAAEPWENTNMTLVQVADPYQMAIQHSSVQSIQWQTHTQTVGPIPYPTSRMTQSQLSLLRPEQTNHMAAKPRAKRPRSSSRKEPARLKAMEQQLSKHSGASANPANPFLCYRAYEAPKNRRSRVQKESKRVVVKVGGACFLCKMLKKPCSGLPPCDTCKNFWGKRADRSTSFMRTCNVRTKMKSLYFFKSSLPAHGTIPFFSPRMKAIMSELSEFLSSLFGLMDSIEFTRLKVSWLYISGISSESSAISYILSYYCYGQSLDRWKEVISFLYPQYREILEKVHDLYKIACLLVLNLCDTLHQWPDRLAAISIATLFLDEVRNLGESPEIDQSITIQVELALTSLLTALCAGNSLGVQKLFAGALGLVEGNTWCPPPLSQQDILVERQLYLRIHYQPVIEITEEGHSSCLFRHYPLAREDNDLPPEIIQGGKMCCCQLAYNSVTSSVLHFFGYRSEGFMQYFHTTRHIFIYGGIRLQAQAAKDIHSVFLPPSDQGQTSAKTMRTRQMTFREILRHFLVYAFCHIRDTSLSREPHLTDSQVLATYGGYHAILLHYILSISTKSYIAFRKRCQKHFPKVEDAEEQFAFAAWGVKANHVRDEEKELSTLISELDNERWKLAGAGVSTADDK